MKAVSFLFFLTCFLFGFNPSWSDSRIVGSSTLFPLLGAVAEHFYFKRLGVPPVIESTGTGGGIKLFCSADQDIPVMVAASRAISAGERALCQKNGHVDIIELDLGSDGMAVISSLENQVFNLSLSHLKEALSKQGPHPVVWQDLEEKYPPQHIKILGPPSTSGTYESLLQGLGIKAFRQDGAYIAASDQESILVQKVIIEQTLGVVSFGFLLKNPHIIFACPINGVLPSPATIRQGTYPLSRRLYVYVHASDLKTHVGLKDFLNYLTSHSVTGPKGLFDFYGLITHEPDHYIRLQRFWNEGKRL